MDRFLNIVDGSAVEAEDFSINLNPSDVSDVVGEFARSTTRQVNEAIDSAAKALVAWRRSPILTRHAVLKRASRLLEERNEELAASLSREEGKPLVDARGEVLRASQVFDYFAGECLRLSGELLDSTRHGVQVEIRREPVGVVGIVTPWNFPIAIPAWKIAPALAWGNTVVFKPAEIAPHSAWLLTNILHEAGLPPGVLNLVLGRGSVVGSAIVSHPSVSAISFTGSNQVGRQIAAESVATEKMKKVQLEMGGKNPLIVLDDADIETALDCAINGAFNSTGQKCTASSRIIVTAGIHDEFVEKLTDRMLALKVGPALSKDTDIGPVVSQEQLDTVTRYIELGSEEGATLHTGGDALQLDTRGFYLQPALFIDVQNTMTISREEIFGPVAAVIKVDEFAEAVKVANDTEFGLSAGICTSSLKFATAFKAQSTAGMVMVNLPTAGVDFHAAFGGRGASSYGPREQGSYAKEFFSSVKTTYTSS